MPFSRRESDILSAKREANLGEFKDVCKIQSRYHRNNDSLLNAFEASVIFSQEEGGSGGCRWSGIILTCCHVLMRG